MPDATEIARGPLAHVEAILVKGIASKWKYDQNDPAACMLGWCSRDAYFKERATPERSPWLTAYDMLVASIGHDAVCDLITYSERRRTATDQLRLVRAILAAEAEHGE